MAKLNIAICLLVTSMLTASLVAGASEIRKADKLYEEEKYDEALELYDKALLKKPEDSFAEYNRAAALYQKRAFTEANAGFLKALAGGKDEIEEKSVYNVGNSKYRMGEELESSAPKDALDNYKQAEQYYRRAIELVPEDMSAKYNYELTNIKIKELQEKMDQDKQEKQDKGQEEKPQEEKEKEQDKKEEGEQKEEEQKNQEGQKSEQEQKEEQADKQKEQEEEKTKSEQEKKQEEEQRKQEKEQKDKGEKDSQESAEASMPEEAETPEGGMTKEEAEMLLSGQEEEEARMRAEQRTARAARRPVVLRDW
ncbi:MAG: hypothetical protein ABIH85_02845 [Candidatus Omnitrophota bacterium]|nr:tetratricopeptide repeat protein [Candidatus Omnitrophota bacterium]